MLMPSLPGSFYLLRTIISQARDLASACRLHQEFSNCRAKENARHRSDAGRDAILKYAGFDHRIAA